MNLIKIAAGVVAASSLVWIGAYTLKQKYSYHVLYGVKGKNDKTSYMFWWPTSSLGVYCTSESIANAEYDKCVQQAQSGEHFKLVRYPVVTRGFFFVVGVKDEMQVLKGTEKN